MEAAIQWFGAAGRWADSAVQCGAVQCARQLEHAVCYTARPSIPRCSSLALVRHGFRRGQREPCWKATIGIRRLYAPEVIAVLCELGGLIGIGRRALLGLADWQDWVPGGQPQPAFQICQSRTGESCCKSPQSMPGRVWLA